MVKNDGNSISQNLASVEKELGHLSGRLLDQFHSAYAQASLLLSPEESVTWAREGLTLARCSSPFSLEAAAEYFQATSKVLAILSFPSFLNWVHQGQVLCRECPGVATAYFQASPRALTMIPDNLIEVWCETGRSLYRDTTESMELARSFFVVTPDLLQSLSLTKIEQLAILINRLAGISHDLAIECLSSAPQVLAKIGKGERAPFLALALTLVRGNPEVATGYFMMGAEVLAKIDSQQQRAFLSLVEKMARGGAQRALSFFLDFNFSQTFRGMDSALLSHILNWAETVAVISAEAAIEFLKSCPILLAKVQISRLERWFEEGVRILRQDKEAGLAYFRLESVDEKALERLSIRVNLEPVNGTLLMYSQALVGTKVQIRSKEVLRGEDMGGVHRGTPATEGTTIFLPLSVDSYHSEEENFAWYKVAVTHQAGHSELGTFDFSFEKEAGLFSNRRHRQPSADEIGLTEMERFFCLFDDRELLADIFTVVEDTRVDYLVKQQYAGIRSSYQRVQRDSLLMRPYLSSLPLREAFLEILVQISLDGQPRMIPLILRGRLQSAVQILRRVQSREATVEDSIEAVLRLYEIISTVPNKQLPVRQWGIADLNEAEFITVDTLCPQEDWEDVTLGLGIELLYQAPAEVEFRGSFRYELAQLLPNMMADPRYSKPSPTPLPAEMLEKLTGKEMESSGIPYGDQSSAKLQITDLPTGAQVQKISAGEQGEQNGELGVAKSGGEPLVEEEGQIFHYDEWDFQACCYLPKWCRVKEKPLAEGGTTFYEETLTHNYSLANQIRKQFEMLSPQFHKKLNRLYDGDELNLDAVIEAVIERKAGHIHDEKIYWKRRKIERDVAVIFLLDMSASTADVIKDVEEPYSDWSSERMEDLPRLRQYRAERLTKSPRRVIDVARESVVLMINAMETIGDCYGVYGFSSYGRENVELLVIKGIDEKFSHIVRRRIDRIAPLLSTRMGPAIRHVTSKLEAREARTKILFLVSDGYPQDKDYGPDSDDKEYALHDTKMALIEAKRKNITPFCLTIDLAGYDYLKTMSQGINYEVLRNIESLPRRLPMLYKRLTS